MAVAAPEKKKRETRTGTEENKKERLGIDDQESRGHQHKESCCMCCDECPERRWVALWPGCGLVGESGSLVQVSACSPSNQVQSTPLGCGCRFPRLPGLGWRSTTPTLGRAGWGSLTLGLPFEGLGRRCIGRATNRSSSLHDPKSAFDGTRSALRSHGPRKNGHL